MPGKSLLLINYDPKIHLNISIKKNEISLWDFLIRLLY